MSIATLSTLANSQHERIDAALQRAENATYKGSREAFAAYDELVAELTRHLFAMEVAVLPVAARSLPGGAGELRPQIDRLRQLEAIELRIEERRSKPRNQSRRCGDAWSTSWRRTAVRKPASWPNWMRCSTARNGTNSPHASSALPSNPRLAPIRTPSGAWA